MYQIFYDSLNLSAFFFVFLLVFIVISYVRYHREDSFYMETPTLVWIF